MFTVEFDHDEVKIQVLDDSGTWDDVTFYIYDDMVRLTQWNETEQREVEIAMSPDMFEEFRKALDKPEGSYVRR